MGFGGRGEMMRFLVFYVDSFLEFLMRLVPGD